LENKLESLEYLIKLGLKLIEEKEQIFIHCSAGVGRSGTFGGILEGIRMFERDRSLSIFAIVENLRKYRYHAVQTF
jgi:protein tyrosine phosphatase